MEPLYFSTYKSNGLWYWKASGGTFLDYETIMDRQINTTRSLTRTTQAGQYELFHQRFGHPGERTMQNLHLHVTDVPVLKGNSFYKCLSCLHAKMQNRNAKPACSISPADKPSDAAKDIPSDTERDLENGQEFSMDFGFMRGSGFASKDLEGRTITSIDRYRSHLLIICRKSRYLWVFLTKTKQPPLSIVTRFLQEHGNPLAKKRTIRTDEGGELWGSEEFRSVINEAGYLLKPTAADAPSQNGMAERPNRTLGNMVRCLLHSANLGPEYWSFALQHAVYLKNRLPHRMIQMTPYQTYTGNRPSAKYLRVFGCPIIVKLPGKRGLKLDSIATSGRFLGYTASDRNVYYMDSITRKVKITTHCVFDEAGMTIPEADRSSANTALQQHGYSTKFSEFPEQESSNRPPIPEQESSNRPPIMADIIQQNIAWIKLLSHQAKMPSRATEDSAGFDVYSATMIIIPPTERRSIPLDISLLPPDGMYAQIMPRSGLASKHLIDTKAGVIDRDYTGNIHVILHNAGTEDFTITIGDRIAQIIFYHISHPILTPTHSLDETQRGDKGFGSTGITSVVRTLHGNQMSDESVSPTQPTILSDESIPPLPYDIYLSEHPFDDQLHVEITLKGDHSTLGMIFQLCKFRNRLQLLNMAKVHRVQDYINGGVHYVMHTCLKSTIKILHASMI